MQYVYCTRANIRKTIHQAVLWMFMPFFGSSCIQSEVSARGSQYAKYS